MVAADRWGRGCRAVLGSFGPFPVRVPADLVGQARRIAVVAGAKDDGAGSVRVYALRSGGALSARDRRAAGGPGLDEGGDLDAVVGQHA